MPTRAWLRKRRLIPAIALAAGVAVGITAVLSPWPAALLIRALFDADARRTVAEMERHATSVDLAERRDVRYSGDQGLDAFWPASATGPLPVVVWIHGGAWISGSKEDVVPYVRAIAASGYATVALDYSVAPEQVYPTALGQLDDALGYLVAHAAELHIDPSRIVLAGDSAGAQLTAQLAALVTDDAFADEVGIAPALASDQLVGVVLNCGIYDVSDIPDAPGIGGWGFRVALWSYLGRKDWSTTAGADAMSTIDHVTAAFPPTWISGGDGDPLTATQSIPFADRLDALGVPTTRLFYPDGHEPSLPHEYQFHLDLDDAQTALASTLDFVAAVTAR